MGGLGALIACIGSGRIARGHGTFSSFGMSMIQPSFSYFGLPGSHNDIIVPQQFPLFCKASWSLKLKMVFTC
jgi:hypothetical protein